jgi:hypothetical protein
MIRSVSAALTRALCLCVLTLAVSSPALAVGEPPGVDASSDVSLVLAQMRQASGGDAWDQVFTLHTLSKTQWGTRERWEDVGATGRYLIKESGAVGVRLTGFDGITSWRQSGSGIPYALGDVDSSLVAADESFRVVRGWWYRDRHPATVSLAGTKSEGERTYDLLSVTPEGGRAFVAWIDRATHLPARIEEQQAEERVVTTYSDYRRFGGLMIPFAVRTGDGVDPSFDQVETVQSIDINPPISEGLYSLPGAPESDVQIPAGGDQVQVRFRFAANNRILVPITLNGSVTTEAEFDSGGDLTLQPGTVARLGVRVESGHKETGGGEGSTEASIGRLNTLSIGGASIEALAFTSFDWNPRQPDEVLMGLEVLQRWVVRLDFDQMIMTLTRPEAYHFDGHGTIIPFHFQDNEPEVKGAVDGIAGLFTLDTGDNTSLLLIAPFARHHHLVERYQADIPAGGLAVTATRGVWARKRAQSVTLDGADGRTAVEVHDPLTYISLQQSGFDANQNVSGVIGLGILRQFNLTFDYARQQLILEPNHFFGQPDIYNRTGFTLKREGKSWLITRIYPDSPAAAAGLQVGDHIRTLAGFRADQASEEQLIGLLRGPEGSTLAVELASRGPHHIVTLTLRDVF